VSRVLIWSPNFAPELTGIPPLVTDAADWLAGRGHEVSVVTAVPNYPERRIHPDYTGVVWRSELRGDVHVERSWLRVRPGESFKDKVLYELTLSGFSLPNVLRRIRGSDVLVCLIPTLTAATYSALLKRTFGSRLRLVLWVQDLVLAGADALDLGPSVRRLLDSARRAERFAAAAADRVVVCSPGFRDYFLSLGIATSRIEVILNWADVDRIRAEPARENGLPTRFLYAGNLGYSQGFETLVDAARMLDGTIALDIVGDGNAHAVVEEQVRGIEAITLRPPVPPEDYPALLARSDVQLVLQRRVSAGANLPSKIATYLASGRPVLASIDSGTPAADLLRQSGGAVLVDPESPTELAAAMERLSSDPALRRRLGEHAREFAVRRLSRDQALGRLEAAILG
jgi:colanic acid biosynthesis glycosyl transferase WcaI